MSEDLYNIEVKIVGQLFRGFYFSFDILCIRTPEIWLEVSELPCKVLNHKLVARKGLHTTSVRLFRIYNNIRFATTMMGKPKKHAHSLLHQSYQ